MSEASYRGLVIVVPTRNRADLAANAVGSVVGQAGADVTVLVSDNSTREEEVARLSDFCRRRSSPRWI